MNRTRKAEEILGKLKEHYPVVKCALNHKSAFQLLIATILSAQCTDKRVNLVTPKLFEYYPTPQKMAEADINHIIELVRTTGFYNNKAKNIKACSQKLMKDFNGIPPKTIKELITLPGVARKTANVLLSEWYGINEGFVVDTHVIRLTRLLKLTDNSDPKKIEIDLMKLFPQAEWNYMSLALIQYGREFCSARNHDTSKCFLGGH